MPKGNWSFLHEWVIYDYFLTRYEEKTLRLKKVIESGVLLGRTKWSKVIDFEQVSGTAFPDINKIQLQGQNYSRPAEVKFTTSLFNYHRDNKYKAKFKEFVDNKGCIIVAGHDHLPTTGLLELFPGIDVYEIEIDDFVSFCRENFIRLLNRQIRSHSQSRVWILYQGPNFNIGEGKIKAARDSMIWCPTENLSGFDLAIGDRILFIKSSGVGRIQLQNLFQKQKLIDEKWVIDEVWIGVVKSKIFSRIEYCQYKGYSKDKKFWKNDPKVNGQWRWNRVFEFSKIKTIKKKVKMDQLYHTYDTRNFVQKSWEAFCYGKSREIPLQDYRNFLETIQDIEQDKMN